MSLHRAIRQATRSALRRLALRSCGAGARVTVFDDGESAIVAALEEPGGVLPAVCVLSLHPEDAVEAVTKDRKHAWQAARVIYLHRESAELVRDAIDRVFPREAP